MGTLRHLRRTLSPRSSSLEAVRQRFEEDFPCGNGEGRVKWADAEEKMSGVIIDFAEPLLKDADDIENDRVAISFAVICWNMAVAKEQGGGDIVDETFASAASQFGKRFGREFRKLAEHMIERKRKLFPDNKRFIVDYKVVQEPSGYHLYVASTADGIG